MQRVATRHHQDAAERQGSGERGEEEVYGGEDTVGEDGRDGGFGGAGGVLGVRGVEWVCDGGAVAGGWGVVCEFAIGGEFRISSYCVSPAYVCVM